MTSDIKQARAEADAARARLSETTAALKYRLTPSVIARRTADDVKTRAGQAVTASNEAMQVRPWLPWTIGAAVGVIAAWYVRSRSDNRPATPHLDTR